MYQAAKIYSDMRNDKSIIRSGRLCVNCKQKGQPKLLLFDIDFQ